nr:hypothetical protein [Pedobacter glucosidilyticus]
MTTESMAKKAVNQLLVSLLSEYFKKKGSLNHSKHIVKNDVAERIKKCSFKANSPYCFSNLSAGFKIASFIMDIFSVDGFKENKKTSTNAKRKGIKRSVYDAFQVILLSKMHLK